MEDLFFHYLRKSLILKDRGVRSSSSQRNKAAACALNALEISLENNALILMQGKRQRREHV